MLFGNPRVGTRSPHQVGNGEVKGHPRLVPEGGEPSMAVHVTSSATLRNEFCTWGLWSLQTQWAVEPFP